MLELGKDFPAPMNIFGFVVSKESGLLVLPITYFLSYCVYDHEVIFYVVQIFGYEGKMRMGGTNTKNLSAATEVTIFCLFDIQVYFAICSDTFSRIVC
jgi:hypothetical protein